MHPHFKKLLIVLMILCAFNILMAGINRDNIPVWFAALSFWLAAPGLIICGLLITLWTIFGRLKTKAKNDVESASEKERYKITAFGVNNDRWKWTGETFLQVTGEWYLENNINLAKEEFNKACVYFKNNFPVLSAQIVLYKVNHENETMEIEKIQINF